MSPSRTSTFWPRARNSAASAPASVDLPAPDMPVNHTTKPGSHAWATSADCETRTGCCFTLHTIAWPAARGSGRPVWFWLSCPRRVEGGASRCAGIDNNPAIWGQVGAELPREPLAIDPARRDRQRVSARVDIALIERVDAD